MIREDVIIRLVNLIVLWSIFSFAYANEKSESICYGTPENGSLEEAWQLPTNGVNFQAYSSLGVGLGRTYVHSKVYSAVVDAYQELAKVRPKTVYVYGETSAKNGGEFRPHKSHQNGLSVDFMVPVLNSDGGSVPLPTGLLNKFGYGIEFSDAGVYEGFKIDFEAMADHLIALNESAGKNGIKIRRVIFDNALQEKLFKTKRGDYLKSLMVFSKKPPWVRHDEHYHVDFNVDCK